MAAEEQPLFQTLVLNPDTNSLSVSTGGQLVPYILSDLPFRVPADFSTATAPSGHSMSNTVPVEFIPDKEKLPEGFISNLTQGSRECFAREANLR